MYARPDVQHLVEPLIVSWGYESEHPSESRFVHKQEWTGTRDYSAYLAVPAALQFMTAHDWDDARMQCHTLAQYARERIHALTGLPSICPDSTDWYMQMFTAPLPPCDPLQLKRRLYDEFKVEVPIVVWQAQPHIRVSIQVYNSQQDIERLLHALARLLYA